MNILTNKEYFHHPTAHGRDSFDVFYACKIHVSSSNNNCRI